MLYYNKLTNKYPQSEYAQKVLPMLEYIASVEPKEKQVLDSTGVYPSVSDSTKNELKEAPKDEESVDTKKEENPEEVKADTTNVTGETKLSQEEIDRLLKESEGK